MAEQFSIPTVGDVIAGKYRVDKELGRGAYGVVFRAEQEELGRNVAVKTLLPQAFLQKDIVQRFVREAQLISRLDHPNIIRLFDYGVDEGLLYMAVEFVEGRTLMDVIDNDAPLPPERARDLVLQMLDALDHAHAHGIVHRDLKPENIVLLETSTSDGQRYEVVKILDFGISKLLSGENEAGALKSLTQDGTVLGTPHYMSPENIVGDPIDHRADLYAIGILLYEMITGSHPFEAPNSSAVMVRHLRDPVPPSPEAIAGRPLGVLIQRCMEKQPWDRIGSAREAIDILETPDGEAIDLGRAPSGRRPPTAGSYLLPDSEAAETVVREALPSRKKTSATVPAWKSVPVLLTVACILLVVLVSVGWKLRMAFDATQPGTDEPGIAEPALPVVQPALAAVAPDAGTESAMVFLAPPPDAGAVGAEEPSSNEGQPAAARPQKRPQARPRPQKDVEAAAQKIVVEFESEPSGASVTIDGAPAGVTPVRRSLLAGEVVEVRFKHIGYKPKVMTVTPDPAQRSVRANLQKDHLRLID